jgi:predicted DNA-binding protein (MmcQ/YjbR family)
MDAERARELLLRLPCVTETMQWGENLVFWAGDKLLGGKMFTVLNLNPGSRSVISFFVGAERYAELLEQEGVFPAPYLARAFWISLERWDVFSASELTELLTVAHASVYEKLPRKTKAALVAAPEAAKKREPGRTQANARTSSKKARPRQQSKAAGEKRASQSGVSRSKEKSTRSR